MTAPGTIQRAGPLLLRLWLF